MKKIASIILSLLLTFIPITASAAFGQEEDLTSEIITDAHLGAVPNAPAWENLNNVSVSFYVVNGRIVATFVAASNVSGVKVSVQFYKGFIFNKKIGTENIYTTDKKYITGTCTLPADDSGRYSVVVTVESGGERVSATSEYSYDADILMGDVSSDGRLMANDARLILRHSARLDSFSSKQKKLADINGDGNINATDARIALLMAASLI